MQSSNTHLPIHRLLFSLRSRLCSTHATSPLSSWRRWLQQSHTEIWAHPRQNRQNNTPPSESNNAAQVSTVKEEQKKSDSQTLIPLHASTAAAICFSPVAPSLSCVDGANFSGAHLMSSSYRGRENMFVLRRFRMHPLHYPHFHPPRGCEDLAAIWNKHARLIAETFSHSHTQNARDSTKKQDIAPLKQAPHIHYTAQSFEE